MSQMRIWSRLMKGIGHVSMVQRVGFSSFIWVRCPDTLAPVARRIAADNGAVLVHILEG